MVGGGTWGPLGAHAPIDFEKVYMFLHGIRIFDNMNLQNVTPMCLHNVKKLKIAPLRPITCLCLMPPETNHRTKEHLYYSRYMPINPKV